MTPAELSFIERLDRLILQYSMNVDGARRYLGLLDKVKEETLLRKAQEG